MLKKQERDPLRKIQLAENAQVAQAARVEQEKKKLEVEASTSNGGAKKGGSRSEVQSYLLQLLELKRNGKK
ncbi:hypothetical protein AGDE_09465 [Angomonas deanei]|nr:hypothetical protein AGDE_09465 [Angomonas deanei]|eukprot:EPY30395.1 hypothetical protein AGDE_09465 [Angomonas deanei]